MNQRQGNVLTRALVYDSKTMRSRGESCDLEELLIEGAALLRGLDGDILFRTVVNPIRHLRWSARP